MKSPSKKALPARGAAAPRCDTGWARVGAMSDSDVLNAARADADARPTAATDWTHAKRALPPGKAPVAPRLDRDMPGLFRWQGRGYQTRIDAVLRAFIAARGRGTP